MKEIKLLVFQLIYVLLYVFICALYVHNPTNFIYGNIYGYDYKESILIVLLFLPIWLVEYYVFYTKTQNASFYLIRKGNYNGFWLDIQLCSLLRSLVAYVFMWLCYARLYSFKSLKMFWFNIIFALFLYEIGIALWIVFGDYIIPTVIVVIGILLSNKFAITCNDKAIINLFCWGSYNYYIKENLYNKYNIIYIVVIETVFIMIMVLICKIGFFKKYLSWRIFHE